MKNVKKIIIANSDSSDSVEVIIALFEATVQFRCINDYIKVIFNSIIIALNRQPNVS